MNNISYPQGHAIGDIIKTIPQVYIVEQSDNTWSVEADSVIYSGGYSEAQAIAVARQHINEHGFIYTNGAEIKVKQMKEMK